MTQLQSINPTDVITFNDWEMIREQAATLVKSGFMPKAIKTPEAAIAIIMTGRELGLGPMQSLRSIQVIEGLPTISPQLMLALVNRTGEVEHLEHGPTRDGKAAYCKIKRRGRELYTAVFGEAEARALGLSNKDNYRKQPLNMYEWRAISKCCRFTFPDALLGIYTPEEINTNAKVEADRPAAEVKTIGPAPAVVEAAFDAVTEPPVVDAPATGTPAAAGDAPIDDVVIDGDVDFSDAMQPVALATKAQKIRMADLAKRLESFNFSEAEWRVIIDDVTSGRTQSRAELSEEEANAVIGRFAEELNTLIREKRNNT